MNENNLLRVSIIVAVYKDIEALDLIVQALSVQTYKNFEVIIAEDNDSNEMKDYVTTIKGLDVKHTFQKDRGIRKTRSINNAILESEGEYLIFIDGDCIPYSTFIDAHVKLSEKGVAITGRRCNLGPRYASLLRKNKMSPLELESSFIYRFPLIALDGKERHVEAGFYVSPDSYLYKKILKNRKSSVKMLGCNYSCWKNDILKINGYDEGYGETAVGDDTDLEWRFKAIGLKFKSAKNIANLFHLYHSRSFRNKISSKTELAKMHENRINNIFRCKEGLSGH